MQFKRFAALFLISAALVGCKSVSVPAVRKPCCGSASCGCANGACCAPLCCVEPEALPIPRVLRPAPSSEAAR